MLRDLKYVLRMFRKGKGVTLVMILSLAIGVAASTVVFSVVNAFLFKALPVRAPEELVMFRWFSGSNDISASGSFFRDPQLGRGGAVFPEESYRQFIAENKTLATVFGFAPVRLSASVDGVAEIAKGTLVSGNYFDGLGVSAFRGRVTTAADDRAGAEPVALISHGFWQRRLGGEDSAVGRTIQLNAASFTIIGITPPEYYGAIKDESPADVSVPFSTLPLVVKGLGPVNDPWRSWIQVMGRLKPGIPIEQVSANFQPVYDRTFRESSELMPEQFRQEFGAARIPEPPLFMVTPAGSGLLPTRASLLRGPLALLIAIATLVLAVVCINVANLMLARAATRRPEIMVRSALGGTRRAIVWQLLMESVLLSLAAGVVSVALAEVGLRLLIAAASPDLPLGLDLRVLMFTFALCAGTGILFGLAPAMQLTRSDVGSGMKISSRTTRAGRSILGKGLLIAQVAISVVMLVGAGLLVRSLQNLSHAQPGFNVENLVTVGVNPTLSGYEEASLPQLYESIVSGLQAIPGVRDVTFSDRRFLVSMSNSATVVLPAGEVKHVEAEIVRIRENFLETMGIPLLAGRSIRRSDDANAAKVAVISQSFAQQVFPNVNPLGQRFGFSAASPNTYEVVGIAADMKIRRLSDESPATMYTPYLQSVPTQAILQIRTAGDASAWISIIPLAIGKVDPNLALFNLSTQAEQLNSNLDMFRVGASIASGLGLLALFLASIALYSILSNSVSQRTGEIGIRVALGAQRRDVVRLIAGQTSLLLIIGFAVGLAASLFLTGALQRHLYQVSPGDPFATISAMLVLTGISCLAGYVPVRRAIRIDPNEALRYE